MFAGWISRSKKGQFIRYTLGAASLGRPLASTLAPNGGSCRFYFTVQSFIVYECIEDYFSL